MTEGNIKSLRPRVFICTHEDMHPYECDGPGRCIHCDRKTTKHHKVSRCAFCNEDRNMKRRNPGKGLDIDFTEKEQPK